MVGRIRLWASGIYLHETHFKHECFADALVEESEAQLQFREGQVLPEVTPR